MPFDPAHPEAQRRRLEALVARLSDVELATPMPDGWTVAGYLAHLAFWDGRAAVLVERWQRLGVGPSEADPHPINDAAKPQWLALPPRVAAEQAIQAARTIDAALEAATADFLDHVRAVNAIDLDRGNHREEHLDEIELRLRRASNP